jgi:serine/threonine protein kinase
MDVAHGDIKPANVLVTARNVPLLTDFETVKGGAERALGGAGMTTATHRLLTPAYAAPEVKAGARSGPCSDMFSFGVMCGELLLGVAPAKVAGALATALRERKDASLGSLRQVEALLSADPLARPTALQLLQHPFFRGPSLRFCIICLDDVAQEGGMECPGKAHFLCSDHFPSHVKHWVSTRQGEAVPW